MCNFGGGGGGGSSTPTYVPPAQQVTSGPAAAMAPGVQVKGMNASTRESRSQQGFSARTRGGSGGNVDSTTNAKRRRSASASLGL